jgi:O-antigen/teichoic acid export membrane protein
LFLDTQPDQQAQSNAGTFSSHAHLARRAARGAAALGVRQVLTYGANILGGVILARLLSPAEFGFYSVVSLLLAFLNIFGGTGLAGNLIRTPEEPSLPAYRAVFTIQELIVGTVCALVWLTAPLISELYHLHEHGVSFFRLIAVSLLLTSLMVVPQVKMERHLAFDKLALIEVCQAISFNVLAVVFAFYHFGILAFAVGLLSRSVVGAILANVISPWTPAFRWDSQAVKSHVAFGFTLQGGQILGMVKDSITPVFVGMFLGAAQMGYATWAMTFASYPALLLVPMQRLYLPFFARLQHDHAALRHFVPRALWIANAIAAPLTVFSVALARPITSLIFGQKWLVAIPLFYCFSAVNISAPTVTPLMGLLNAIGKPHLTLWVIGFAMIGVWILGVPLIMYFGLLGFGFALIGASFVNLFLYWLVWRETNVLPWSSFWPAWPISLVIGVLIVAIQMLLPAPSVSSLLVYFLVGFTSYCTVLWYGFPEQTRAWFRLLKST